MNCLLELAKKVAELYRAVFNINDDCVRNYVYERIKPLNAVIEDDDLVVGCTEYGCYKSVDINPLETDVEEAMKRFRDAEAILEDKICEKVKEVEEKIEKIGVLVAEAKLLGECTE